MLIGKLITPRPGAARSQGHWRVNDGGPGRQVRCRLRARPLSALMGYTHNWYLGEQHIGTVCWSPARWSGAAAARLGPGQRSPVPVTGCYASDLNQATRAARSPSDAAPKYWSPALNMYQHMSVCCSRWPCSSSCTTCRCHPPSRCPPPGSRCGWNSGIRSPRGCRRRCCSRSPSPPPLGPRT